MAAAMHDPELAKAFSRTGRVGFWAQVVIGLISIAMAVSALILNRTAGISTRGTLALLQYLTLASLLVLAFTTCWSYRYGLLGTRLAQDAARAPPLPELRKIVWIGVAASSVGLILSLVILLFESTQLFIYFLRAPQAGVPVIQTKAGATWVSAGDILSLTVVILSAFVEFLVLAIGLWLLFIVTSRTTARVPTLNEPDPKLLLDLSSHHALEHR